MPSTPLEDLPTGDPGFDDLFYAVDGGNSRKVPLRNLPFYYEVEEFDGGFTIPDEGHVLARNVGSAAADVDLPDPAFRNIPNGWSSVVVNAGSGTVTLVPQGSTPAPSPNTIAAGQSAFVYYDRPNNIWIVVRVPGDITGANIPGVRGSNIQYLSQNGSDSNSGRTRLEAKSSLQQAILGLGSRGVVVSDEDYTLNIGGDALFDGDGNRRDLYTPNIAYTGGSFTLAAGAQYTIQQLTGDLTLRADTAFRAERVTGNVTIDAGTHVGTVLDVPFISGTLTINGTGRVWCNCTVTGTVVIGPGVYVTGPGVFNSTGRPHAGPTLENAGAETLGPSNFTTAQFQHNHVFRNFGTGAPDISLANLRVGTRHAFQQIGEGVITLQPASGMALIGPDGTAPDAVRLYRGMSGEAIKRNATEWDVVVHQNAAELPLRLLSGFSDGNIYQAAGAGLAGAATGFGVAVLFDVREAAATSSTQRTLFSNRGGGAGSGWLLSLGANGRIIWSTVNTTGAAPEVHGDAGVREISPGQTALVYAQIEETPTGYDGRIYVNGQQTAFFSGMSTAAFRPAATDSRARLGTATAFGEDFFASGIGIGAAAYREGTLTPAEVAAWSLACMEAGDIVSGDVSDLVRYSVREDNPGTVFDPDGVAPALTRQGSLTLETQLLRRYA